MKVLGTLNEYQARLFVAQRALDLGRGGITSLARLTGMSRGPLLAASKSRADLPRMFREKFHNPQPDSESRRGSTLRLQKFSIALLNAQDGARSLANDRFHMGPRTAEPFC